MIASVFRQGLPFKVQCRIDEDVPFDQVTDDFVKVGGLHPLVEKAVLVSRRNVHTLDRPAPLRAEDSRKRNPGHMFDAGDSPFCRVERVQRMGDHAHPGSARLSSNRGENIFFHELRQLHTACSLL